MSSASLILTDSGLALSEPKAVGAQGSTKVLAASSLGSCLVFVSGAVVTVALAAIGRDMRLSPLDLQWVMNAELLLLAALTLIAGALGDRFGQKRILLAASEALGTSCLGAGERGHYGTAYGDGPQYGSGGGYQYGYARQVPSCISRGTSLNGTSPLLGR